MRIGLQSAKLKLDRAEKHIKDIEPHLLAYAARVLHEVVTNPKGKKSVHVGELPPIEISILAGEALYQMRSTLDYLVFDLVKLNLSGSVLPANWEENCCFPLWVNAPKKPPRYNCFESRVPGISNAAFTFIESVQPYHRRDAVYTTPNILYLLAQLSNIDKHRHLNLTPVNVSHLQSITTKVGMAHTSFRTLRDGTELKPAFSPEEMADAVKVESEFSSYLTFDESALGPSLAQLAVTLVLQSCLDVIQRVIVPAFEKLVKNP